MSAPIEPLPHLIEECYEEAAFLWSRWEADLASISRNLDEVWIWSEDRLLGALEGACLASDSMLERMTAAALEGNRRHQLAVLAFILSCTKAARGRELLSRVLAEASGMRLGGLLRGLEVARLDGSFAPITKMLSRQSPEHAAALARLKAFRRASLGDELKMAFESNDPVLQASALRSARRLPQEYAAAWVDAGLKHPQPVVRLAALETGLYQRVPNAWREALSAVRDRQGRYAGLLPAIAMLGNEAEHRMVFSVLGEPALQRLAIWSLGTIGTQEAAHYCISALKHANLARIAAEAYCAITGLDLVRERMTAAEPEQATPAFEDDDLDANLVPLPDAQWPLPDAEALRGHWQRTADSLRPGVRYLRGKPSDSATLLAAMEAAPMLRRSDYALELAVRSGGSYDVETRSPRHVQRQMMAAVRMRLSTQGSHAATS